MGMQSVEIVMACEDEFDIKLPDEMVTDVYTVGELQEVCLREIGRLHPGRLLDEDAKAIIMHQIREIVSEAIGVAYEKTVPAARFIEDLKMD